MELTLKLLAVALIGAAAYFYWLDEPDRTFVCAVLAVCSFFLSIRFRIKDRMSPRQPEDEQPDESHSS